MVFNTLTVGAAVTPQVIGTAISHYTNRKPLQGKPTAHISYDQGLHLVRQFLDYASHHTVEEVQAFTAQWVPCPTWVKASSVTIPEAFLTRAASALQVQLGPAGLRAVGGSKWWQWRPESTPLKAEWLEMRADFNARTAKSEPAKRVILYVHGGAYYFGSVDEHRYQLQRHARKLKARLIAPRYRLAPQFPFPCGLLDAIATYLFLIAETDPRSVLLAGDSAGAGMVISLLVTLRDQGLPMPAGAILLSPWVDLTHSFPSLGGEGELDYIPSHGFHHRPSAAWPPPNATEMKELYSKNDPTSTTTKAEEKDKAKAFKTQDPGSTEGAATVPAIHDFTQPSPPNLSVEMDGKHVELLDQIQMYAPNHLLAHPLVSPVMQPSLGGLPPLLIQTGGGELLRDEQIYLAHKAASPSAYMPPEAILDLHDPDRKILKKYPPTKVQLQVWDDLCHVPHTLSFTRPAKYMYRAVAQFGNWCYANSLGASADVKMDSDALSVVSSGSSEDEAEDVAEEKKVHTEPEPMAQIPAAKMPSSPDMASTTTISATGPLPAFHNHMIRQRVNRHGAISPLESTDQLDACRIERSTIGAIKPGPVRKWLARQAQWDKKYASQKRKVQSQRAREIRKGFEKYVDDDGTVEIPPPTALAGRRLVKHGQNESEQLPNLGSAIAKGKTKSWGLAMWAGWGSKHDTVTVEASERPGKQSDGGTPSEGLASAAPQGESSTPAPETSAQTAVLAAALPEGQKVEGSERTFLAPGSARPHNGEVAYPFKIHDTSRDQGRSASTLTLQSAAEGGKGAISPMVEMGDPLDAASPEKTGPGISQEAAAVLQRPKLDTFVTAKEF